MRCRFLAAAGRRLLGKSGEIEKNVPEKAPDEQVVKPKYETPRLLSTEG